MVRVKVCGIRNYAEAKTCLDAGADALGFIFAPSPRRVDPEAARELILKLPPFVTCVGVFADEKKYHVQELATFCRLDVLQFHGIEAPAYCRGFSQRVIKAFKVKDTGVLAELDQYGGYVDTFLLDTFRPGALGGTGHVFDWQIALQAARTGRYIILAGGLTPENVGEAIKTGQPYGVDVRSGVETDGNKDPGKVTRFIEAVRRTAQ